MEQLLVKIPKEVVDFIVANGAIFDIATVEADGQEKRKAKIFLPFVFEGVYDAEEPIMKITNFMDKGNEFVVLCNYLKEDNINPEDFDKLKVST